jgi:hypothetical protein
MTDFGNAELVLIDRLDFVALEQDIIYDYYGVSVRSRLIPTNTATYVYYYVDQDLAPTVLNILVILSRHFLGNFEGYYNDWCSDDNVYVSLKKADRPMFNRIVLNDLPKPKISGEHHIHFTVEEIITCLPEHKKHVIQHVTRLPPDTTTSFAAGVLLWLASLPADQFVHIIKSDLLDSADSKTFMKAAKNLSVQAKSLQNLVSSDLRNLFEVDVLVNRSFGQVDWVGEKKNRLSPNLTKLSDSEIYSAARQLFTKPDATREKPRRMTWEKYWDSRWQWSASGSIHSQYEKDLKDVPKERELKNKFIALCVTEDKPITHYTHRNPEIRAWSSVKYEWGKMRAIYGTDLTSYVLAHYAFFNCEDVLPADFPVGLKARPSFVAARVAATLEGTIPLCIDFEDFNSQHSNGSMKAVIRAYIDSYSHDLDPSQIEAAKWTHDSIDHTRVHDNMGTKTTYDSKGTLMSGWRLTTFMNSVLNYIYTMKIFGGSNSLARTVHNGDDVLAGVKNFKLCTNSVKGAAKYGIRLQRTKCAFGGIAEFLRVDHMRGTSGQYLTRNIATLVHSRIESKMAVSIVDVVAAMEDRLREFVQRGGSRLLAANLRENYYNRVSKQFNQEPDDLYYIKTTHSVAGGISIRPDANVKHLIVQDKVTTEVNLPTHLPGVNAYALTLKKTLNLDVKNEIIIKRIRQATLNAVQLVRTHHSVIPNKDEQRYTVYRALKGAYSDVASMPLFGKAMLTGFIFDVLTQSHQTTALSRLLNGSKDPITFLRVLT